MSVTATTTYTDLFSHDEVILDTLQAEFTTNMNALSSGAIQVIPDSMAGNTDGYNLAAPMWDELDYTGASQISATADAPAISVQGELTTIAPYSAYEQRWGADYLARAFASKENLMELLRQIAMWAANMVTYHASRSTQGAFATALASTHEISAAASITAEQALLAKRLLGDKQDMLSIALMHGYVASDAARNGLFTYGNSPLAPDLFYGGNVPKFVGSTVFQSDQFCYSVSDLYPTYFAAPGAIIAHTKEVSKPAESAGFINNLNAGNVKVQVEQSRTQDRGGTDSITARISVASAVQGLAWQSGGGVNPAISSLATGSNWAKVSGWADKNIKIVRVTSGLAA